MCRTRCGLINTAEAPRSDGQAEDRFVLSLDYYSYSIAEAIGVRLTTQINDIARPNGNLRERDAGNFIADCVETAEEF